MADPPGDSLEARQYNMRHFGMRFALKKEPSERSHMWDETWLPKAACIFLMLHLAVCPARAENHALKRGFDIANEKCSHCHAITHDDIPLHAIVIPFRQLYRRYPIPMLVEARERGVIAGHDEMPMFTLAASDVRALLAYIDSLAPHAPGYARNQKSPKPIRPLSAQPSRTENLSNPVMRRVGISASRLKISARRHRALDQARPLSRPSTMPWRPIAAASHGM